MILDLDGGSVARPLSPRFVWMLGAASAAVASAVLLALTALPHAQLVHGIGVPLGPSVIAQAMAKPKEPTLALQLPTELATEIPPLRVDGVYGPARPTPKIRTFRMRDTNALVLVAMLPDAQPVYAPSGAAADALSVHGVYAANYSVEATSLFAVRWTERGVTYEISSRSVTLRDLVALAERVR
ncbi:MAG TPA: hypothetical protein VIA63_05645 [Candidatus Limnocylindria bacterium]